MSYIWKSWILLFAVSFLPRSELSVSVKCNKRVTVEAGDTATLNCTISYLENDCKCLNYSYGNKPNNTLKNYSCEKLEKPTHVSLNISNVTRDETYYVTVDADCGVNQSDPIRVKVETHSTYYEQGSENSTHGPEQDPNHLVITLSIVIAACVLGILCVLLGRRIVKHIIPNKPHETSVAQTDEEEFLSASQTLQP